MKRRDDSRMYRRVLAAHTSMLGARVLLDLANVADTDFAHFRRRYLIFPLGDDDTGLRKYRDELREVWRLRLGYHRILDDWTRRHQVSPSEWSIPLWVGERGIVEPNPTHLGLLLTMAIRDNAEGLGFCPNPNCPHPYFAKISRYATGQLAQNSRKTNPGALGGAIMGPPGELRIAPKRAERGTGGHSYGPV
jgi:hypothetical protein